MLYLFINLGHWDSADVALGDQIDEGGNGRGGDTFHGGLFLDGFVPFCVILWVKLGKTP